MILLDTTVLLYAVNQDAHQHQQARGWLDDALSGAATVGFAWVALLGFLRISTRAGVLPRPLRLDQALSVTDAWLQQPPSVVVHPTAGHQRVLAQLLEAVGVGGNLLTDAHLAALALEHRASIASFDRDFDRFPGVHRVTPGAG
jgi:toxin-antitoxin system PIN domain toxin